MASTKASAGFEHPTDEVVNTVVEEAADVGVERFFTITGRDPFEEVEWELRDAFIPGKDKAVFDQKEVEFPKFWSQTATNIVAQKYFRGQDGLPGARDERQADDRPGRRHDRRLGSRGRLLRRRRGGRHVRGRAEGDPRQPVRLLQLPRLVQRRLRGEAAVLGLLHPLDRRLDGVDPRLDPPRGDHLPRRLGLRRQPLAPPLLQGAALEGRLRLRAGLVHARRRRLGRHDQVGRQDAARGEDGRPRRRPPGRRATSSGARRTRRRRRACSSRPATTWRSTPSTGRRSSTRTRTTRSASPTPSWRRPRPAPSGI